MMELIFKALDLLFSLNKYQAEKVKETYDEILNPLFNDLETVHKDYIQMFEDMDKQLATINCNDGDQADKDKLLALAEALRKRRIEFEPVREKLAAMAGELGRDSDSSSPKIEPAEAEEFIEAVIQYFPRVNLGSDASRSTVLLVALYGEAEITPTQVERYGSTLPELLKATMKDCREKWKGVCDAQAKLKITVHVA